MTPCFPWLVLPGDTAMSGDSTLPSRRLTSGIFGVRTPLSVVILSDLW